MLSRWIEHVVQFRSLIAVDGSRRMRKVNFPRIIGIWLIDLTPLWEGGETASKSSHSSSVRYSAEEIIDSGSGAKEN